MTVITTNSETESQKIGADLADSLFQQPAAFVQLTGPLGAGKTSFARGFIKRWLELSGETEPEAIASPTFNIVKTYGSLKPLAHLDLYRLSDMSELESIGFEHYFFEFSCCLVEWLEQIPEALSLQPLHSTRVEFIFGTHSNSQRILKISAP